MSCPLFAGMINSPLSSWLMTHLAGIYGLKGWQWLFLVEGLPCVILGITIFFILDDTPAQAKWLSPKEKALLNTHIAQSCHRVQTSFLLMLKDARVYIMAFTLFCLACSISIPFFWLPTILKAANVTSLMQIGMLTAIPYLFAVIAKFMFGISSDYYRERRWHGALSALLGVLGLCIAVLGTGHLMLSLFSMICVMAFVSATYNVFMAMVTDYLKNNAAAGGIAFITSISTFGSFISPSIMGLTRTVTGSFQAGLFIIAGILLAGCISIICNVMPSRNTTFVRYR